MLRFLYNALWYPALPIALRLANGREQVDRRERLGFLTLPAKSHAPRTPIWLHAASVGEIEGVCAVAQGLIRELPYSGVFVTAMTAAGREAARKRIPQAWACALAPFDSARIVDRFLRALKPKLVLIAETELWPNYFLQSRRFGAKIAIVNGRISARSLDRYQWAPALFAETINSADLILAQTEDDARRFRWLGAQPERIVVSGNSKYDLEASPPDSSLRPELETFATGKPILIAGSTAPDEEQLVLHAYLKLLKKFPDLALILAPRHLRRVSAVEAAIEAAGLPYVKSTAAQSREGSALPGVLLLDTMGELRAIYRRATVAFVGGSMVPGRDGQNLAEPAAAAVPVLFGPFHKAQQQIASALIAAGGGAVVNSADQLADTCAQWLSDQPARDKAGKSARAALEGLAGSLGPTLMRLKALVSLT